MLGRAFILCTPGIHSGVKFGCSTLRPVRGITPDRRNDQQLTGIVMTRAALGGWATEVESCGRAFRRVTRPAPNSGEVGRLAPISGPAPNGGSPARGEFCRTRCAESLKNGKTRRRKSLFSNRFRCDFFEDYDETKFVRQNSSVRNEAASGGSGLIGNGNDG